MGITLLEKLRLDLQNYRSKYISENVSKKMQDDLDQAERRLKSAEISLNLMQDTLNEAKEQQQKWIEERDRLTDSLGGGGDIKTSQDLL